MPLKKSSAKDTGKRFRRGTFHAKRVIAKQLTATKPKASISAENVKVAKAAATAKGISKEPLHTKNIKFLGVGVSEDEERFLKVAVREKTALLNVDNVADSRSGELKILTRLGEPLIKPQAKSEFVGRAHDAAREEPTFKVVTKTGWRDGGFVLPPGLAAAGETDIERYFDWRYAPYHRRLRREGSLEGWLALAELCRGKSRLVATLCLALSGPVCGMFGDEAPGMQLVSKGGMGNTTIGRVAATVWGGDRNPARKIGCGVSCNNTGINFEVLGGAFDQMLAFFDDMHNAGETELKAIHNMMNGEGRGRSTDARRAEFCTPMLCGANTSLVRIATKIKCQHLIIPLIDRLMEIGLPVGAPYFFEGIRTKAEFRAYGNQLRKGARENFGWAGPEFVDRLGKRLRTKRAAIEAFVEKRQQNYHDAAADIGSMGNRDSGRISNKFSTIYVSGCLAFHLKVLPFTEAEVLEALLTCHRDHMAFIDHELGFSAGTPAPSVQGIATGGLAIAAVPDPAELLFDRARRFVNNNRKSRFHDARKSAPDKAGAARRTDEPVLGYIGEHDGREEYLILGPTFKRVAGGAAEDLALKRELFRRGLLVTDRRGDRRSFVVKRYVPGKGRVYVVALRLKAEKRSRAMP